MKWVTFETRFLFLSRPHNERLNSGRIRLAPFTPATAAEHIIEISGMVKLRVMKIYRGAVDICEVSPTAPTFPAVSRDSTPCVTSAGEFTLITATSPAASPTSVPSPKNSDSYRDLDRCIGVLRLPKASFYHTYCALSSWIIYRVEKHRLKHLLIEGKQTQTVSGCREGNGRKKKKKSSKNEGVFACHCTALDVLTRSYLCLIYSSVLYFWAFARWRMVPVSASRSVFQQCQCERWLYSTTPPPRLGRGFYWLNHLQ